MISMALISLADPVTADSPDWYPPEDEQLRIYAIMDIGRMATGMQWPAADTDQVVLDTVVGGQITEVAGHPALVYELEVEGTDVGRVYARGAEIVSRHRSYQLLVLGSTEPNAPGSVSREDVNRVWDELVASIILPD